MSDLKWTKGQPTVSGHYWSRADYGVSRPFVTYYVPEFEKGPNGGIRNPLNEPGQWSFAGPMPVPPVAEWTTGIPTKPGFYLELSKEFGGNLHLPFMVLPDRDDLHYNEMTYYGPFPQPSE